MGDFPLLHTNFSLSHLVSKQLLIRSLRQALLLLPQEKNEQVIRGRSLSPRFRFSGVHERYGGRPRGIGPAALGSS